MTKWQFELLSESAKYTHYRMWTDKTSVDVSLPKPGSKPPRDYLRVVPDAILVPSCDYRNHPSDCYHVKAVQAWLASQQSNA